MKKILQDYSLEELSEVLGDKVKQKFRYAQIYDWTQNYTPVLDMSNLPLELRQELEDEFTSTSIKIEKVFTSKDGTKKYLLRLSDDNLIECVLMEYKYRDIAFHHSVKFGIGHIVGGVNDLFRRKTKEKRILNFPGADSVNTASGIPEQPEKGGVEIGLQRIMKLKPGVADETAEILVPFKKHVTVIHKKGRSETLSQCQKVFIQHNSQFSRWK